MGREARVKAIPDSARHPDAFTRWGKISLRFPWFGWASIWITGIVGCGIAIGLGAWDGGKRGAKEGAFRILIDLSWFKGELRKLRAHASGEQSHGTTAEPTPGA